MPRKKSEGIESLVPSGEEPVSIQELTMQDWYAGFALMGLMSRNENPSKEMIAVAVESGVEAVKIRKERISEQ